MEDPSPIADGVTAADGPSAAPRDLREWLARAEHRYIKQFSRRTRIRRSVCESVTARWQQLGFTRTPPRLWSLEE